MDLERANVEHVFRVLGGIPAAARGVQAFKKLEEHFAGEVKEAAMTKLTGSLANLLPFVERFAGEGDGDVSELFTVELTGQEEEEEADPLVNLHIVCKQVYSILAMGSACVFGVAMCCFHLGVLTVVVMVDSWE